MGETIGVLGGGSWGATVASHLARVGHSVRLWEFMESQVEVMRRTRGLPFLPQLKIPEPVLVTAKMEEALKGVRIVFSVVPSQFVRQTWKSARPFLEEVAWVASFSKGIETSSLKRVSEVIEEEAPAARGKIAAVSGPSHAEEVAREIPTAVVSASRSRAIAESAQRVLASNAFRVYTSPDIVGVEVAGSLKNIFAIATGACDGLGLGDNTKSALITRGLSEMAKLGVRLGGQQVTFFGLAGMGDLTVTCLSQHSRNRLLGEKIGQGKKAADALQEMTMVAEGYPTALSAYQLVQRTGVNCPIIVEIYRVLYEGKDIRDSMNDLLSRPPHGESSDLVWEMP